jgi:hypothetical protein
MAIASISTSSIATYDLAKTRQLAGGPASTKDAGTQDANKSKALLEEDKTKQLSEADAAQLAKLQARDRAVRQHEMAHLAVSGGLATSGASFTYQKRPDGVNYAIGGEVCWRALKFDRVYMVNFGCASTHMSLSITTEEHLQSISYQLSRLPLGWYITCVIADSRGSRSTLLNLRNSKDS